MSVRTVALAEVMGVVEDRVDRLVAFQVNDAQQVPGLHLVDQPDLRGRLIGQAG